MPTRAVRHRALRAGALLSLVALAEGCGGEAVKVDSADSRSPTPRAIWTTDYTKYGPSLDASPPWFREQEPRAPGPDGAAQGDRVRLVTGDEVPAGKGAPPAAMRVELRRYESAAGRSDGDVNPNNGGSSRAEVYGRYPSGTATSTPASKWPDPVGSTRWYGFSIYLPKDFRRSAKTKWLVLTQWKEFYGGTPPQALEIDGRELELGGNHGTRKLGGATRGRWINLQFGFHWSPDRDRGWIEVWRDGRRVVREQRATMDRMPSGEVDPIYLKQGIYRNKDWPVTHIVYFGPTTVAGSREGLAPIPG